MSPGTPRFYCNLTDHTKKSFLSGICKKKICKTDLINLKTFRKIVDPEMEDYGCYSSKNFLLNIAIDFSITYLNGLLIGSRRSLDRL